MIERQISVLRGMQCICPRCDRSAIHIEALGYSSWEDSAEAAVRYHVECCVCGIRTSRRATVAAARSEWLSASFRPLRDCA